MLRSSLLRASNASTSSLLIRPAVRASRPSPAAACLYATQQQQQRQAHAHAHAISNPTLANIEKRWEAMPPQEQADLWMQLRDRMKNPWNEMTLQEKKAGTLASRPELDGKPSRRVGHVMPDRC